MPLQSKHSTEDLTTGTAGGRLLGLLDSSLTGSSMTCKVKLVWEDLLTLATGMQHLSSSDRTLAGTRCHMAGPVVLGRKLLEATVTLMTCNSSRASNAGNNMAVVVVSTTKQFLAGFALMETSFISRVLLQLMSC